jgi:4-hydroxybenzoate polyprenyltransferase
MNEQSIDYHWYRLSRRVLEYVQLTRLNRPIGIWLLIWPMLWSLWIAGRGRPAPELLFIFLGGAVLMRSAGCVINDFLDRKVDAFVRRTRQRPLAARRVAPQEALVLFGILTLVAFLLVMQLNEFTLRLSCIAVLLAVSYPLMKRFFPLPQFYLGLAFGWAVPMAFAAQLNSIPRLAWVLFVTSVVWAVIYDTLYAMVDREDDLKLGLKSSAILFADMDKLVIGALQAMMLFALLLIGKQLQFGYWFYISLVIVTGLFLFQQWLIRQRDTNNCLRAFLHNHYVGLVIFIGIALEYNYAPS